MREFELFEFMFMTTFFPHAENKYIFLIVSFNLLRVSSVAVLAFKYEDMTFFFF
jgi:hypothetical protein